MSDDIDDRMEEIMRTIQPFTDTEKKEILLGYFDAHISAMDGATLATFRARCAQMHQGTAEHDLVLEVIDGELALRALRLR